MSLEDKLKSWREATEALAPSEKLMAALERTVEAPTPPAGVSAVVKVLLVTAVVGVVGVAVLLRAQQVGWGWFAKTTPVIQQVTPTPTTPTTPTAPVDAGEAPCGPRPQVAYGVPLTPGLSQQEERAQVNGLRQQLTRRPLNCLAQRYSLQQLLWRRAVGEAEELRLISRLGYLCGGSAVPWGFFSQGDAGCDDSDWCHEPQCELATESCALSFAARPRTSCAHLQGRRAALAFACVRFLRGQGTEAQVRALEDDAWCLKPDALKESLYLRQRDAGMELP